MHTHNTVLADFEVSVEKSLFADLCFCFCWGGVGIIIITIIIINNILDQISLFSLFVTHDDVVSINGGDEEVCVQVLQQEVPLWEVSGWPHQDSHDE